MPAKLSAPYFSNSSAIIALEALPDTGRMMTRGRISEGSRFFTDGCDEACKVIDKAGSGQHGNRNHQNNQRRQKIFADFDAVFGSLEKIVKDVFLEKRRAAPTITITPQMTADARISIMTAPASR